MAKGNLSRRGCSCPNLEQSLRHVGYSHGALSFPSGGQCLPGKPVGFEGCTWKEAPLSFSLSADALSRKGVFDTNKSPEDREAAALASYSEIGAAQCGSEPYMEELPLVCKTLVVLNKQVELCRRG